jgi:hypothetical protein
MCVNEVNPSNDIFFKVPDYMDFVGEGLLSDLHFKIVDSCDVDGFSTGSVAEAGQSWFAGWSEVCEYSGKHPFT